MRKLRSAISKLMVSLMIMVPVATAGTVALEVGHAAPALANEMGIEDGYTYEPTGNFWMDGDCMYGEYNIYHEYWLVTRDAGEPISWDLLARYPAGTETYREWCV